MAADVVSTPWKRSGDRAGGRRSACRTRAARRRGRCEHPASLDDPVGRRLAGKAHEHEGRIEAEAAEGARGEAVALPLVHGGHHRDPARELGHRLLEDLGVDGHPYSCRNRARQSRGRAARRRHRRGPALPRSRLRGAPPPRRGGRGRPAPTARRAGSPIPGGRLGPCERARRRPSRGRPPPRRPRARPGRPRARWPVQVPRGLRLVHVVPVEGPEAVAEGDVVHHGVALVPRPGEEEGSRRREVEAHLRVVAVVRVQSPRW